MAPAKAANSSVTVKITESDCMTQTSLQLSFGILRNNFPLWPSHEKLLTFD